MQAALALMLLLTQVAAEEGSIIGSPHDFRKYSWKRSGEICLPCHAPHSTKTMPVPLWNHELSPQTYIVYRRTRPAVQGAVSSGQPDGMSKICLSCHDGILASDAYGGSSGATVFLSEKERIGIMCNNHPISFVYDTALAVKDNSLYDPSVKFSGVKGSTGTIDADMLFMNWLECTSCHDVHNTKAVPGTKLLVKEIAGSALCLTCHDK